MTALAATVGIGNIAGVATAISIGGPGALFWMWVIGVIMGRRQWNISLVKAALDLIGFYFVCSLF